MKWTIYAIIDWVIILLCIGLICYSFWFLPLIILIGSRQHALLILGHDATHYLSGYSRKWNDIIGNILCYLPFFLTIQGYRDFHFCHHRKVGTPDDPERVVESPLWNNGVSKRELLTEGLKIVLGLRFYMPPIIAWSLRKKTVYVILFWIFVGILIPWPIILIWIGSFLTWGFLFFYVRTWFEHIGETGLHHHKLECNRIISWLFLPHNAAYHADHHEKCYIPFYDLPKLRKEKGISLDNFLNKFIK